MPKKKFFDDNTITTKKSKKDLQGLEHNPLISKNKNWSISRLYNNKGIRFSFISTVHLVKHKTSGEIRAMKAIKKGAGFDDEDNKLEIINVINILMKIDIQIL